MIGLATGLGIDIAIYDKIPNLPDPVGAAIFAASGFAATGADFLGGLALTPQAPRQSRASAKTSSVSRFMALIS